jgi:hypothetical protein
MTDIIAHGVISAGDIYGIAEFRRRTGLQQWAIRTLRKRGLRVHKIGNKLFVTGDDFLAYLREQAEHEVGR